jgi:hypothetical protein
MQKKTFAAFYPIPGAKSDRLLGMKKGIFEWYPELAEVPVEGLPGLLTQLLDLM